MSQGQPRCRSQGPRGRRAGATYLDGCSGRAGLSGDSCAGQHRGGSREGFAEQGCKPGSGRRLGEEVVSARAGPRGTQTWGARRAAPHRGARRAPGGKHTPRTRIQTPEAPGLLSDSKAPVPPSHLTPPPPHLPRLTSPFHSFPSSSSPLLPKEGKACVAGKVRLPLCPLPTCVARPSALGGALWIIASGYLPPAEGLGPKRRFRQNPEAGFFCS